LLLTISRVVDPFRTAGQAEQRVVLRPAFFGAVSPYRLGGAGAPARIQPDNVHFGVGPALPQCGKMIVVVKPIRVPLRLNVRPQYRVIVLLGLLFHQLIGMNLEWIRR
jgi:hypothetical protein